MVKSFIRSLGELIWVFCFSGPADEKLSCLFVTDQSMLSNWPHLGCHRSQRVSKQPYEASGTNYSLSLEKLSSTCPVVSTRELPKVAKVTLKLVRLDFPEKNIFKVVVLQQVS